jgi:hypothetical protein
MKKRTFDEFYSLHSDEYFLKFRDIPAERRLSNRADLNAFMLLDKLLPGVNDIVTCAEHDEIYLEVDTEKLMVVATDEQLSDLIRCGCRAGDCGDGIAMFV